ncbi:nitric oxide reductase FlRd-NAD(+) reductase [Psychromonas marina]|uniref:Nitric oxide reductase FlRd-NAD(+) reductase n=1 Tax=Psychromonas marina TaxID=88364 RepID=A0ABQ6E1U3_9GAMM|nr:NADH:flavorubredoxin reductase NorW [Psychromonas marina]GLS91302.1 nitric oxide reductase FlRd-NAD(+) reductase [Psychromonas marina]
MNPPIIIIGSGFGAYQLIKTIRRTNKEQPISVFTLDAGHDYNKPDLSHVFSKQQSSADLIRTSATDFASEFNITLHPFTEVEHIDTKLQQIVVQGIVHPYSKLVLATGAKTFIPPMLGEMNNDVLTLNSLQEFESAQPQLQHAQRILVIGAGLIGTEIAMDLASCGKSVTVVDPSEAVMANMLPTIIADALQKKMQAAGITFKLNRSISSLSRTNTGICALLNSTEICEVDCVISAAGLKANTGLAKNSGLEVNMGILVNQQLQTSAQHVYALGDCAEINGKVRAYLQPIMLSANALAKTLLAQPTDLALPAMLIKVKTPLMPIQLGGDTVMGATSWQVEIDELGSSVKAYNQHKQMIGFVVTEGHMKNAFPLLRALPANL